MYTHTLNPVLFDFGIILIRWYSLAYIGGIVLGWWLGKKIISFKKVPYENLYKEQFDNLITYIIVGVLIGGRIGYILFYNLSYYTKNPLDIFKIWQGGMSFHGALIGIILVTIYFSNFKEKKVNTLYFLDIIACVAPIGLFFGRIANFINAELVGKVTNVSWGVIFPNIDNLPRHPSQLYEAFLEGFVLFLIMILFVIKKDYKIGTCSSMFLIFYGIFRIFCEFFREPDPQIGYFLNSISMGSILSSLMILGGAVIFIKYR